MQWTSQQDRRNGAVRMDAERSSVTPYHGSSHDVPQEISTRHPGTSAPPDSAPLYHLPPINMTCPPPRPSMSSSRMPLFRANTVHTVTHRDYFNHFYHYKDYASPLSTAPRASTSHLHRSLLDSPGSFARDHGARFRAKPIRSQTLPTFQDLTSRRVHPYASHAERKAWDASRSRIPLMDARDKCESLRSPPMHSTRMENRECAISPTEYGLMDMRHFYPDMRYPYAHGRVSGSQTAGAHSPKISDYYLEDGHYHNNGKPTGYVYPNPRYRPVPNLSRSHEMFHGSYGSPQRLYQHPSKDEDKYLPSHSLWSEDDASSSDMLEKQELEKMTSAKNTPAQAPPKRGGKLPKHITDTLKAWLLEHADHPYPTEDEKRAFCDFTGLDICQISNWFVNARRRILAPAGARATSATGTTATNAAAPPART